MTEAAKTGGGSSLTTKIMVAMALGVATGLIFNRMGSPFIDEQIVGGLFAMIGKMFVNALKMLVVPLVIFSLLTGVMGIGDIRALGRVGGRAFVLYILTTAIAINPMFHFVDAYRSLLYDLAWPSPGRWLAMGGSAAVALVIGSLAFRRLEPRLAEEL